MSDKRKSKKWYKNIWIWVSVLAVIGCIVNIVFAYKYREDGPNIFTAISGWVSGIATCIIGVIAALQSKKYKEENDRFIDYQQKRDWILEQKELVKAHLYGVKDIVCEIKKYQYSKILQNILHEHEDSVFIRIAYDDILKNIKEDMAFIVLNCSYYFDGLEELFNDCERYILKLRLLLNNLYTYIKNKKVEPINEVARLYKELINDFDKYIYQVQTFVATILSNETQDVIEKELNSRSEKKKELHKRLKETSEEMIKQWQEN